MVCYLVVIFFLLVFCLGFSCGCVWFLFWVCFVVVYLCSFLASGSFLGFWCVLFFWGFQFFLGVWSCYGFSLCMCWAGFGILHLSGFIGLFIFYFSYTFTYRTKFLFCGKVEYSFRSLVAGEADKRSPWYVSEWIFSIFIGYIFCSFCLHLRGHVLCMLVS